jgi:deoxycytidylate deaminase
VSNVAGKYLAKSASLRSSDLSRQVGAAIIRGAGDVLTLGCNVRSQKHREAPTGRVIQVMHAISYRGLIPTKPARPKSWLT